VSDKPVLQFKKIRSEAVLPAYMTKLAAGLDIRALPSEPLCIAPGERTLVPTGLAVAIEPGYEIQVRPRSGLALHHGITLLNTPGTIDADYRGEIGIIVINHGQESFKIEPGDRIAQLVVAPVVQCRISQVDELTETSRGSGGFGHTGINGAEE
jgi:dUTP pyrophosphatase